MHHPITPGKPPLKGTPVDGYEHYWAKYRKAEQKLAAEEAASGKTLGKHGSTEIERLRSQLSRMKPRDIGYGDVAKQLSQAYADAFPGEEPDNAH